VPLTRVCHGIGSGEQGCGGGVPKDAHGCCPHTYCPGVTGGRGEAAPAVAAVAAGAPGGVPKPIGCTCGWTRQYPCPGSALANELGREAATDDGSACYWYCCAAGGAAGSAAGGRADGPAGGTAVAQIQQAKALSGGGEGGDDWSVAFVNVNTETNVPVNVQVGDTAQKQALDATVALTNTAVADRHGYVPAGYVRADGKPDPASAHGWRHGFARRGPL